MIANIAGKDACFAVGEVPWHGKGTVLDNPATSAEAVAAANLDWRVTLLPMHARVESTGALVDVKDRFAVAREDTLLAEEPIVLGTVGCKYRPIQNSEAFAFMDSVVGEKRAVYHTAGALGQGERVWLLAKLPQDILVTRDDRIEQYLLLSNSHDGSSAMRVMFTHVRVVCNNTLTLALGNYASAVSAGDATSIRHTASVGSQICSAVHALGLAAQQGQALEERYKLLAAAPATTEKFGRYADAIYPYPDVIGVEEAVANNRIAAHDRRVSMFEQAFERSPGNELPGVRGTMWAAYNAYTDIVDHGKRLDAKSGKPAMANGLSTSSLLYGAGAQQKRAALEAALEIAATN